MMALGTALEYSLPSTGLLQGDGKILPALTPPVPIVGCSPIPRCCCWCQGDNLGNKIHIGEGLDLCSEVRACLRTSKIAEECLVRGVSEAAAAFLGSRLPLLNPECLLKVTPPQKRKAPQVDVLLNHFPFVSSARLQAQEHICFDTHQTRGMRAGP